jgi:hypothetical protein
LLKQIARLEVKFWAKAGFCWVLLRSHSESGRICEASVAMLKELDAESRLERIAGNSAALSRDARDMFSVSDVEVDWLQTFGDGDSEDSSSGPAVLFQVPRSAQF